MSKQDRFQRMVVTPKSPLASKTMWFALVIGFLTFSVTALDVLTNSNIIADNPEVVKILGLTTALLIAILRWATSTPLQRISRALDDDD